MWKPENFGRDDSKIQHDVVAQQLKQRWKSWLDEWRRALPAEMQQFDESFVDRIDRLIFQAGLTWGIIERALDRLCTPTDTEPDINEGDGMRYQYFHNLRRLEKFLLDELSQTQLRTDARRVSKKQDGINVVSRYDETGKRKTRGK